MPSPLGRTEIISIHLSMAAKLGRTILVKLYNGGAVVKTLVKQTDHCVRLAEYNREARQLDIDRRDIKAMFRVTGKWDGV